jgi:hypothetical protein
MVRVVMGEDGNRHPANLLVPAVPGILWLERLLATSTIYRIASPNFKSFQLAFRSHLK